GVHPLAIEPLDGGVRDAPAQADELGSLGGAVEAIGRIDREDDGEMFGAIVVGERDLDGVDRLGRRVSADHRCPGWRYVHDRRVGVWHPVVDRGDDVRRRAVESGRNGREPHQVRARRRAGAGTVSTRNEGRGSGGDEREDARRHRANIHFAMPFLTAVPFITLALASAQAPVPVQVRVDSARREVVITAGPYRLPANPPGMHEGMEGMEDEPEDLLVQEFAWPLTTWVRGFRLAIVDSAGRPLPRGLMHHMSM